MYGRNSADKNSNGEEKRGEREMAAEQPERRGPISAFQHTLIPKRLVITSIKCHLIAISKIIGEKALP